MFAWHSDLFRRVEVVEVALYILMEVVEIREDALWASIDGW